MSVEEIRCLVTGATGYVGGRSAARTCWSTATIASLWIGLVTPIPTGLARPLIESLECDAVMAEHDIDTVIPPPANGLTGYRDAVARALRHGPLPSDPAWAGPR